MAGVTGSRYWRGGARTPGTVTVQPAALVRGLASTLPPEVDLRETSPVDAVHAGTPVRVECRQGVVHADRLLVAANGYTRVLGWLDRRVFPLLTFASLTPPLTPPEREALGGAPEWGLVPENPWGAPCGAHATDAC